MLTLEECPGNVDDTPRFAKGHECEQNFVVSDEIEVRLDLLLDELPREPALTLDEHVNPETRLRATKKYCDKR